MTKISACVLLPLFYVAAYAAPQTESWICIGDKAVGFVFNQATRQWEPANFKAGTKYLLSRPKIPKWNPTFKPTWKWEVNRFGESDFAWTICDDDFTDAGTLYCGKAASFSFNRNNLRFMTTYAIGYVYQGEDFKTHKPLPEGGDTPNFEIGTCTSVP